MKITTLLPAIIFAPSLLFSQSFSDGTNLLSLGFGIPPAQRIQNDFNKNYKNFIDYKLNNYGTLLLKFERGLHDHFGLGLNAEYSAASVKYKYDDINLLRYERQVKSSLMGFYLRFNGHLPLGESFDIYGGLGLGYTYTVNKYSDTNPDPDISIKHTEKIFEFDYQFTLGARYMIKESIGLFGEFGWASTNGQAGIVLKF